MYKAILFAPDGEWITDYSGCDSPDEVIEKISNQGSRWIFYPYAAVIVDHGALTTTRQRIVIADEEIAESRGHTIRTTQDIVRNLHLTDAA